MLNPYIEASQRVYEFKKASNLLDHSDRHPNNRNMLLLWALAELRKEVLPEIEKEGTTRYNHGSYMGEMHDVYVLASSEQLASGNHDADFASVFSANGVGRRSDIYERIEEHLLLMIDDKRVKAFNHFLKLYYSALKYSPGGGQFLETFIHTALKINKNRPGFLYNTYCPILGRELREEECFLKYQHLEGMTRHLRDSLDRDLEYSDCSKQSRPDIYWLMVNWIESDWAFKQLIGICEAEKNGGKHIEASEATPSQWGESKITRPTSQEVVLFSRT